MLEILFLGTGASVPSRDRAPPCIAVRCRSDIVLLDCGEGSQRQLMISKFSFMKISCILISHMHGDHVLGLPGLLQTMGLSGRKKPLMVAGPEGLRFMLESVFSVCSGKMDFPLEIRELSGGEEMDMNEFSVSVFRTEHGIPSLGFSVKERPSRGRFNEERALALGLRPGPDFSRLQNGETVRGVTPETVMGPMRPGCSVVYSGDTVPCEALDAASSGADVLIHESTYSHKEAGLAKEYWHSTSVQAAVTAKKAGCRCLMLTHVSNRYDDRDMIEKEARETFPDTFVVKDMEIYRVTKEDIRSV